MSKDLRSVPSTGETFRESVMRLQRMPARTTRERLCALIASGGRVVRARRLPGGLQCGTHAVDLVTAGGELMRLVFRRYTPQQAAGDAGVAEREWQTPLVAQAFAGAGGDVMVERTTGGPAAFGAAPVLDEQGRPIAAVVVALSDMPSQSETPLWQSLAVFGVATIVVLAASSLFAIASSSLVSYLLARQLVRRLERPGAAAAEAFAAGDLTRRVDERSSNDEVGQLACRFNDMADRLAETLEELGKAKERAEAALEAKRQLVANVSHELRTPMASIRAHTESL